MKKIRKLCFVLSLLLVLSFFVAVPALAATPADLINYGSASVMDNGSLVLSYTTGFVAYDAVDKGKLTIKVQYYNGGWYTVQTLSDTDYNTYFVTDGGNVSVSSAGYYRLSVSCRADDGSYYEIQSCTSSSSYIN